MQAAWTGMLVDSTPTFYVEHLKRLRAHGIQPYFVPAHVHQLEIIERLIRAGVYMGPMNVALCGYGGGTLGRNPFDWMEMLRRTPHGAIPTFWSSMRGNMALQNMAILLGAHVRVGNEDNIWGVNRQRWESVQQVEWAVQLCEQFGRQVATAEEARTIMKVGVWYNTVEETLFNLGLPPNRAAGRTGFLSYDTDGRLPQPVWTDAFMATGIGIYASGVLPPKEVELLSIAFDASYTHMYAPGTRRHIQAALQAGATMEEVMEVLKLCVVQGVQACNLGVPILAEELARGERNTNDALTGNVG